MDNTTKSTINDLVKTGTLIWYNGSHGLCPGYGTYGLTKVNLKMTYKLSPEQSAKLRQAVIDKCNEYAAKFKGWSKSKLGTLHFMYEDFEFAHDLLGCGAYMTMRMNDTYYRKNRMYGNLMLINDPSKPNWGSFPATYIENKCHYSGSHKIVFNDDGSVDFVKYIPVQAAEDKDSHKHRAKCRNEWQKIFKAKLEKAFAEMKFVGYSKPLFDNQGVLQVEFASA